MSRFLKIGSLSVLLLQGCFIFCFAQLVPSIRQQKIVIYNGNENIGINYDQISYLASRDAVLTIEAAQQDFTNGKFILNTKKYLNLGIAQDNYWITVIIVNTTRASTDLILNLENPRLNEADIYTINKKELRSSFILGDIFPFRKRALHFNQFAVPFSLAAGDTMQLFMFIKHRGNTLQVPMSVHNYNSFLKKVESSYLITGITCGILALTFFFSIFLFIKSRKWLFIFYSSYVFSTLMWLISTEGFGFQYLWPAHPEWATRFGPGFSVFNLCSFIATALAFTRPYNNTKWIRKTLYGIVVFSFLWGLQAFMPYIQINNTVLMSIFLKTSFVTYLFALVLIMSYLLYVSVKINRIVWFYFFTGITTVVFSLLLIAQNTGWINLPLTSGTFISIGLVFEIILMTVGIATQFYQYKKDKETMLVQFIEQQRSITQKILETQDRERKRISSEMHDDIGPGLTQITLMSESAKTQPSVSKLDDIANTSRQLVNSIGEIIWSLNPEYKTMDLLCAYLHEQLSKQLEYSGMNYSIQLPDNGKEIILTTEQRRSIVLVTKEIVNNAIKYSNAKNILVKAELINGGITFTIRDDGTGFDTLKVYSGNGLKNTRKRVEELGGQLKIFSDAETGSSFNYFIPISPTT